jgi:nucleoside 2-deoxyribosyltransferase
MIGGPSEYLCENRPDRSNRPKRTRSAPFAFVPKTWTFWRQSRMHLYLAGPLFTQAERSWNHTLAAALEAAGHSVFVPQLEVQNLSRLEADAIFRVDLDGVRAADAVVAVLDGADADSGTCFECGVAYAIGIPIVAVRTDFRGGGDALPGQKLATVNLMLAQAAAAIVALPDPRANLDAVAGAVVRALAALPPAGPRIERKPR